MRIDKINGSLRSNTIRYNQCVPHYIIDDDTTKAFRLTWECKWEIQMCPSKLELASNGMTINLIRLILLPLPYFFVRLFVLTKDLFTLLAFVMSFIRFANILNYYYIMFFFMLWKSEIEKNTKVCVLLKIFKPTEFKFKFNFRTGKVLCN